MGPERATVQPSAEQTSGRSSSQPFALRYEAPEYGWYSMIVVGPLDVSVTGLGIVIKAHARWQDPWALRGKCGNVIIDDFEARPRTLPPNTSQKAVAEMWGAPCYIFAVTTCCHRPIPEGMPFRVPAGSLRTPSQPDITVVTGEVMSLTPARTAEILIEPQPP